MKKLVLKLKKLSMLSEFKILVWPQRDIYYIPFSVAKTDPFDLKKHRSTQPPPLEKKTLLRSGKIKIMDCLPKNLQCHDHKNRRILCCSDIP